MKKLLLIALLIVGCVFTQQYEDVVILKNGSEIYGTLIEHIPNEYTIVTGEGDPNITCKDDTLYWTDRSIALHMKMYSEYLELGKCIWGLGFTPELYYPLTQNHILKDYGLSNFDDPEKQWANFGKMDFYNFYFPEIINNWFY